MKEILLFMILASISIAIAFWIQDFNYLLGYTVGVLLMIVSAGLVIDRATKERK